jgi:ATP-binding cassette subfamily B (MDR/TAP) protein 1
LVETEEIETILRNFNIQDCKPIKVPIPMGAELTAEQCPKTQEEIEDMIHVPYASVVVILMYAMVCTRPNISHAMGVLSRYMLTPGKEH